MRNDLPPRLFQTGPNYYRKPERRLRPRWQSCALGHDPMAAIAEAKRLNKSVDAWLKAQADGAPAVKRKTRLGPSTVSQLVTAYKRSEDWRSLRDSTHDSYTYEFTRLEAEFGHEVAATLSLSRVDDWLDALRRTSPATARNVLSKGRLLFSWAARKEMIPPNVNPFKGQRRMRRKDKALSQGGKRFARFSWADVQLVVAAADAAKIPSVGTALVIAFACVQRISDVQRLTRRHIAGGRLRFIQSKTGRTVDMALPAIVAERLAAAVPLASKDGRLVVSEETKLPYHEKTISRVFKRLVDALVAQGHRHLAGHQLRDGRRSGFIQYVLDGASVEFVCSLSLHSIEEGYQIVEHYLPKTPEQADKAVALLSVKWGA